MSEHMDQALATTALLIRKGLAAVREWEAEHGAFTAVELLAVRRSLDSKQARGPEPGGRAPDANFPAAAVDPSDIDMTSTMCDSSTCTRSRWPAPCSGTLGRAPVSRRPNSPGGQG